MPDDPPIDPDTALMFAFFNEIGIINQLSRTAFEARLPAGVTIQHFSVLNHLIRVADGRTPLELARAFQVPKNSMTNTLSGLHAREWITFRPHPSDRRSKRVWLTDDGRAFRNQSIALLGEPIAALAGHLDMERIRRLTPALTEIRQVLDNNRDL